VILAWLPAALYMALIWAISSMEAPEFPTHRFPLRDKGVHFVEFAVLGVLVAHACVRTFRHRPLLRVSLVAVMVTAMWGLLDEIHQAYVPGRSSDALDVFADSLGALGGVTARVLAGVIARRIRAPSPSS
jgi:VanZ family protein